MIDTVLPEAAVLPKLIIRYADAEYEVLPEDAPITIGRQLPPAQIVVDDPRISRVHARIEIHDDQWHIHDRSTNGVYVDGVRRDDIPVTGELTVRLGHPEGIPVSFILSDPAGDTGATAVTTVAASAAGDPDPADVTMTVAVGEEDEGIKRAGAAVARRRQRLGISQRRLAAEKIVNAGALIAFEKGRSWPRRSTREKLEEILQWPRGTIERIRQGGPVPDDDTPPADDRTEAVTTNIVQAPLMAQAIEIALRGLAARIESVETLPEAGRREAIRQMLDEIRHLEDLATDAARSATRAPDVALALSDVRRTYHGLMMRAAQMPDATRGQKLYAARQEAQLTPEEAANVAGIDARTLLDAEADRPLSPFAEQAIDTLLKWLARR
ncbi:FHA domain-containing protein [uncultured Mycolicibacterium sp.]|uniref:FHA domain-containing protein n=1 Tax=uncultured Mycolicibacterium sp. TaxID=2320817 RepID=UPI00261D4589|nr:FHA domain-containing protein [uncultured Mycolicibacterium sp.]